MIGINLLREGLDIPECGLVAILDADKEGFAFRNLADQTIGRAARNADGRVIMYADRITGSMERALNETERRRVKQIAYNQNTGLPPKQCAKMSMIFWQVCIRGHGSIRVTAKIDDKLAGGSNLQAVLEGLRSDMRKAAENLEFEELRACAMKSNGLRPWIWRLPMIHWPVNPP